MLMPKRLEFNLARKMQFCLTLWPHQHEKLRLRALSHGTSMAAFIAELVEADWQAVWRSNSVDEVARLIEADQFRPTRIRFSNGHSRRLPK